MSLLIKQCVLILISNSGNTFPVNVPSTQGVNKACAHTQYFTLLQTEDVFDNIVCVHLFGWRETVYTLV